MLGLNKLMKSAITRWIAGIVTGTTAIIGTWTGYKSMEQQAGGILSMQYNGEVVQGTSVRNLVICVDSAVVEKNFSSICPNFYNSKKYTVRDLSLRYEVVTDGVQFEPTGMYTLSNEGDGTYMLRYTLDKLASYETTSPPVRKFIIPHNGGEVKLRAMASFDGADSLMTYQVNAKFVVIDNAGTQNFEEWRNRCRQRCAGTFSPEQFDAYYISLLYRDHDYEYSYPIEKPVENHRGQQLAQNDSPKNQTATEQTKRIEDEVPEKFSDENVELSNVQFYTDSVMHAAIRRNGHQALVMLVEDSVEHSFENFAFEFFDQCPTVQVWNFPKNLVLRNFAYLDEDADLADKIEYDEGRYENKWSHAVAFSYYSPSDEMVVMEIVPPKGRTAKMEEQQILRYYSMPEHVLVDANKQVFFWTEFWNGYKALLPIWVIIGLLFPMLDSEDRKGKSIVRYYRENFFSDCLPIALFALVFIATILIIVEFILW